MNSSTTDVRKPAMARRPTQSYKAGSALRQNAESPGKCTEGTDRRSSLALHEAAIIAHILPFKGMRFLLKCDECCEPTSGKGLKPNSPSSVGSPMESATCVRHTAACKHQNERCGMSEDAFESKHFQDSTQPHCSSTLTFATSGLVSVAARATVCIFCLLDTFLKV